MGRSQISTLTGVWKKLIPTLMDDFDGFKASVEEVTEDVVEIARELGLEVEPEDVTELLRSQMSKEGCFGRWDLILMQMMQRLDEMTTKDLKYYINLVDKTKAEFERIDSNFERSTVVRMLSNIIPCHRETVRERKSQSMQHTSLLSYFKKLQRLLEPSTTTTLINQQPGTLRQDPPPTKRL
ncbi:hypothetical protein QTO34_005560 [Cnephaeus nilssonii]|uniref:Uncharacterized protein n=1 Tax=Cnephaeus nilssonii TaxID=3371016 RepID=A0AA40HNR7_CNENI|nr:hypothetical protein QTO34_005560 [Eptesicus nilssonii]